MTTKILWGIPKFDKLVDNMEETLGAKVLNAFGHYYVVDEKNLSKHGGMFGFHQDSFYWNYRVISTIGNSASGKTMTFRLKGNHNHKVTFSIPHGTVVCLSKEVAGVDNDTYQHADFGNKNTLSLGFEVKLTGSKKFEDIIKSVAMKQVIYPNTVYRMPTFDSKDVVHLHEYIKHDARLMAEAVLVKRGKSSLDNFEGTNEMQRMSRCITDADAVGHFEIVDAMEGIVECTHCFHSIHCFILMFKKLWQLN